MRHVFATRVRTIPESLPTGVRPAILIGAWLALTILFLFASVVLVSTVGAALGQSLPLVATLLALVGILGASGVAPTLAQVTVIAAVERLEAAFDRDADETPDSGPFSLYEMEERDDCQPAHGCCC